MSKMANFKRWYDKDATVSLAVSILRNTTHTNQALTADFIIKQAKDQNISVKKEHPTTLKALFRRWYDQNDRVAQSLDYLRCAPDELQKKMALEIIDFLYKLDEKAAIDR